MPRPAVPHHLDSLNVQSIVHMMFMAFLIMISVCCTFLWSFLKVYCEQNYSCHNFTYLSAGAPLTAQPFLLSWSILLSFPCLKFVIIFPVGKCFINMYSHTHTHTHTHTKLGLVYMNMFHTVQDRHSKLYLSYPWVFPFINI